ncbi:MAG: NADH-quinone oxidoreductase subunit L [Phycisphaera sp.]|nr:NADH-quinone oxidoreductase subunit L [Phycisphaera sp.]
MMLTLADSVDLAKWIPAAPFLSMVFCAGACCFKNEFARKASAWVTIGMIAFAFLLTCMLASGFGDAATDVNGLKWVHGAGFEWINIGDFSANFTFYIDTLTIIMLSVVTGIGTLIAWYAMGYMDGDPGYSRFFAYISLFIFAMTCLVMGDNLLLLYLGWEGVGLASYLLIGFYYRKPSAIAAAKKAFIVNRVGDFGFALGLMGVFVVFGTIQYADIIPAAQAMLDHAHASGLPENAAAALHKAEPFWNGGHKTLLLAAIPFLLMMGAFGKSAQLPLHVWLPDAMEGPTPVSALIHAATMVTAGVYMIARLITVFQLNPEALQVIAAVGGITAFFAATIAMCQYDLKRVWAYSTISQLGYMFLGVGVLATGGAIFHLVTHAFFKALLFLTAGSVMHAMSGQLDLRKISGLQRKMPVTCWLMFAGCLALAGVPGTSGWFSKDMILVAAWEQNQMLAWVGIITALMTAFYTFRLWFRVFMGPERYEMGHEHHGYPMDEHHGDDHGHHAHEPHEMPMMMNLPLFVLAIGAVLGGFIFSGMGIIDMVDASTAHVAAAHGPAVQHASAAVAAAAEKAAHEAKEHEEYLHNMIGFGTGLAGVGMILLAAFFHWFNRGAADIVLKFARPVQTLLYNKYYIDELYDAIIRKPLKGLAWFSDTLDAMLVDQTVVDGVAGGTPPLIGRILRTLQRGSLQGYALTMGLGLVVLVFLVAWKVLVSG